MKLWEGLKVEKVWECFNSDELRHIIPEEIKAEQLVGRDEATNPVSEGGGRDGWNVCAVSSKIRNKRIKIKNGNGNPSLLKVVSWNLGLRQWHKKVDDVIYMVQDHNPDVAAISEANMRAEVDQYMKLYTWIQHLNS